MEIFTRLFKSCFSLFIPLAFLTLSSIAQAERADTKDIDDVLTKTAFPSGFKPSTKCEDALLEKSLGNLPSVETLKKLATQDKVLLIHKASHAIASKVKKERASGILIPKTVQELERLAEPLKILSEDSLGTLQKYQDELLAIAYELSSIAASSDLLSKHAVQGLLRFHETLVVMLIDQSVASSNEVIKIFEKIARLNLIALKSAHLADKDDKILALDIVQLKKLHEHARTVDDYNILLSTMTLMTLRAMGQINLFSADMQPVYRFAVQTLFHNAENVFKSALRSNSRQLPTDTLWMHQIEKLERMPELSHFPEVQKQVRGIMNYFRDHVPFS